MAALGQFGLSHKSLLAGGGLRNLGPPNSITGMGGAPQIDEIPQTVPNIYLPHERERRSNKKYQRQSNRAGLVLSGKKKKPRREAGTR